MPEPGRGGGGTPTRAAARQDGTGGGGESAELRRLRRRIDALDKRIVRLLNQRAELGREVGRAKRREGRRGVRDTVREREVLLRVAIANGGPLRQGDLLAIYRRLVAATRQVEAADVAEELGGREARQDGRVAANRRPGVTDTGSRVTRTEVRGASAGPHESPAAGPRGGSTGSDESREGEPPAGGR